MYVVTQSHKIVNIDRFDTIEIDEKGIYALSEKREVLLGRYEDEETARAKMFDLSSKIGTEKVYEM